MKTPRINWMGALVVSCLLSTACATLMGRYESVPHVPGSDAGVAGVKAQMSVSNAVDFLGKYIVQYVDGKRTKPVSNDPISQMFSGQAPTVSTNGFTYWEVTSTMVIGNKLSGNMRMENILFTDVLKAEVTYRVSGDKRMSDKITLYDRKGDVVLVCNMRGSDALVPRVLAAVEILCPNMGKTPESLPASGEAK